MGSQYDDFYDLVRRSTGEVVCSVRASGRYLVYTTNGVASMRPLLEDEIIFTQTAVVQFLRSVGYRITPPSDNMKSTA